MSETQGNDPRGRRVIDCAHMTVEYDSYRGMDAVLLVPFPAPDDADERSVLLVGSLSDIAATVDSIQRLLSDLEPARTGI